MVDLLRDLRLGFRALRAAPHTTAAAALVIALGTGANLAVFTVAYGILLRPLPYSEPERLVTLTAEAPDGSDLGLALGEIDDWRRRLRTIESLAGFGTIELAVRGAGEPRMAPAAFVTEGFFEVFGVAPARGSLVAFGGSAAVAAAHLRAHPALELGQGLRIGEQAFTLAAVMPPDFAFPSERVAVWIPAVLRPDDTRRVHAVARLRPAVSLEQAREDARRVWRELRGQHTGEPGSEPVVLTPVEEALLGDVRPMLIAAMAAAVLVLLVTCGNVAGMLLGRAAVRRREAAVRLALGAGGWRLARAFLAESLLLASLGSLLGLALAAAGLRLFARAAAGILPRLEAVRLDGPALAAAALSVLAVALLCGAAPALHLARTELAPALHGRGGGEPRHHRWMAILVVGQIAVSVVLLAGAGLLARTFVSLLEVQTGAEPERALVVRLSRDESTLLDRDTQAAFARRLLEPLRALPGVETAGIGSGLPPDGLPFQMYLRWISETRDEGRTLSVVSATPGFLDALGVRPTSGHLLTDDDWLERPGVVLSESTARLLSPAEEIVGRDLPMRPPPFVPFTGPPRVLGVVPDVRYAGLDQPPAAALYLPWSAHPTATAYLVARTAGEPEVLASAVARLLRELDPEMPYSPPRSLAEVVQLSIAERRLRVLPAAGFAAVAFGVALAGVFAMLSRAAAERRREMAIRLALGATRRQVVATMLRRAAALTAAGLAVGLAALIVVARGLRSLLFGVGPNDPATLAVTVALIALACLAAAWRPARRAAEVEPWEQLRSE